MADPLYWREKHLSLKIETGYAQDAAPTASADVILCQNVRLMPMEGADVSRELDTPYMGAQPTIPNELHAKLTFEVELAGSGIPGTPPPLGVILRACGCAEVIMQGLSVSYSSATTGHESATAYMEIAGNLHKILGCRGTAKIKIDAQAVPKLEVEMLGLFLQPVPQSLSTPDFSAWQNPLIASTANTPSFMIDGVSAVMRSFSLDLANQLQGRFLVGAERIIIEDRSELIETQIEALPLSTLNPYTLAAGQETVGLRLDHGIEAGNLVRIDVARAQMQRPTAIENQNGIVEWPLRLVPLPNAGNDQFIIEFF